MRAIFDLRFTRLLRRRNYLVNRKSKIVNQKMNILQQFSNDLAAVGEGVLRSLVQVRNGRRGAGAGTIWHADGLIVTNAHVVDGIAQGRVGAQGALAVVLPDGRELPAYVIARDTEHDLAALRVEANDLPTIPLGDSHQLQPGQLVLCLGFPWGVTGGATSGVVIGVGDFTALQVGNGFRFRGPIHRVNRRMRHCGGERVD